MKFLLILLCGIVLVLSACQTTEIKNSANIDTAQWSITKANNWYNGQPWLVGCNFIPSTAINQLEMWQEDTFDPETIDKELGWAADIGFNTVRVYLHDLAWESDAEGFKKRVNQYLQIADKHGIKTLFVIFDDCWFPNAKIGKQPEPVPGVHNSGWLQSPGKDIVNNPKKWDRLEKYVQDIVNTFGKDERILMWDLYNEPGMKKQKIKSLPLLKKVFEWAREAAPTQPLTAGVWSGMKELNDFQLSVSDIITFHNYKNVVNLTNQIATLKKFGRPVICTEWLLRKNGGTVQNFLPIFKKEDVGCYNWGLVSGKTQTIYSWASKKGDPEPDPWFHDLLKKDGSPFDPKEINLFKKLTDRK